MQEILDHQDEHELSTFGGLYGSSRVMRALYEQIQRVGRSDATVLITGESGTGKELVARAVHDSSNRRRKPFIALNCSALPAELVESELFGHVRGSFTGATNDHAGLFQAAHGGTLFLDEIGDLAPATQAKVLRVLENGEILRVGSTQTVRVDVRVIAATNRTLENLVAAGTFRDDLFYRLKVVKITIPPLRERRTDIPQLVRHFLRMQEQRDRRLRSIEPAALRALELYNWPGNVRELRNTIAGALVMADDNTNIELEDLPTEIRNADSSNRLSMNGNSTQAHGAVDDDLVELSFAEARAKALERFDRQFLSAALARNNGNIARTARSLGLHRQSLQKLMARRGIKSIRNTPADSQAVQS